MPRILQMAEDFAERFAFEPSRVAGIVKALREAGLIKAGARGVNAPDAQPMDAARILIGMMLRVKLDEVAEGVRLFGGMRPLESAPSVDGAPPIFEHAIAATIMRLSFPGCLEDNNPIYTIFVDRDHCFGVLSAQFLADDNDPRWDSDADSLPLKREFLIRYMHPEFEACIAEDHTPTPELLRAWRRYRSGFHEVPTLHHRDLLEIGQVLAGRMPPLERAE